MEIRIGTSGWQYRHWEKSFYPEKLRRDEWLKHYAELPKLERQPDLASALKNIAEGKAPF